jgi:hypothetical protein
MARENAHDSVSPALSVTVVAQEVDLASAGTPSIAARWPSGSGTSTSPVGSGVSRFQV